MGLTSFAYKKIDKITKDQKFLLKQHRNKLPHVELIKTGEFLKISFIGKSQSRGFSTAKLISDCLKNIKTDKDFLFRFFINDKPNDVISKEDFYYCLNSDHKDYLIPDFAFDSWPEAGITSFEEITNQMLLKGLDRWNDNRLFWIGNKKTNVIRERLIQIGEDHPDKFIFQDTFVDNFVIHKKDVPYTTLPDHCKYKYLIDVEGNSYSARLKFLFYSRRVVFIQDREWKEYFHDQLVAYKHYIPVKNDLSNLVSQYEMIESKPDLYQEIINNAYKFAIEKLTYQSAIKFMTANIINRINNL
ncbi:glycosyl transferase family 90 [Pedobacter punctiformis]|uniref:Glycosyl transferase family 90 n=1 Tax=Pedobacter punctiformis TaxID=3004097 RepID=A0ABT4L6E1_9SPHI|nr:glycosyl transferase family 90 [Pedobacter sp. HCMS5-2]MCZ4243490.1 glycosyl transferase family 90 [Pedobacter sp. HCMS5-2]